MTDPRDDKFKLSDATIHRIQSLLMAFQEAAGSIAGFPKTKFGFFVRRDFDFDPKMDKTSPVFNATFYNPHITKAEPLCLTDFPDSEIDDLYQCAVGSVKTTRLALESAKNFIKEKKNLKAIPKDSKLEYIHSCIELFSRVSYKGAVPSFMIEQFNRPEKLPLISHVYVEETAPNAGSHNDKILRVYPKSEDSIFDPEKWIPQPPVEIPVQNARNLYLTLQKWIEGLKVGAENGASEEMATKMSFHLMVIPVFDFLVPEDATTLDSPTARCGALVGFIFFILDGELDEQGFELACASMPQLIPHLNAFAAALLDSEFEEILREDYHGGDPVDFLKTTLSRIDGWRLDAAKTESAEKVTTFGKNSSRIEVNLNSNVFSTPSEATKIFCSKLDDWTVLPTGDAEKEFQIRFRRRLRHFHKLTTWWKDIKDKGSLEEDIKSRHDYSKDIAAIAITMDNQSRRLEELVTRARDGFVRSASPSSGPGSLAEFEKLVKEVEGHQWDATCLARFMRMHMRAGSARKVWEDPAECAKLARKGTRESLEWLAHTLVWEPHDEFYRFDEVAEATEEKTRKSVLDLPAWGRVFVFEDEINDNPDHFALFGRALAALACTHRITSSEIFDMHFLPTLQVMGKDNKTVYEDPGDIPEQPPGLLPLLVWSMRVAVRHSVAAVILDVLDKKKPWRGLKQAKPVRIRAAWVRGEKGERRFEWEIRFEIPGIFSNEASETLPLGQWDSVFSTYRWPTTVWDWSVERKRIPKKSVERIIRFGFMDKSR